MSRSKPLGFDMRSFLMGIISKKHFSENGCAKNCQHGLNSVHTKHHNQNFGRNEKMDAKVFTEVTILSGEGESIRCYEYITLHL